MCIRDRANVVKRILSQADPATRRMINELLQYPEDSAGGVMTTELMELRPDMTVAQAMEAIRQNGFDKETINNCYVTDGSRKLGAWCRCGRWCWPRTPRNPSGT